MASPALAQERLAGRPLRLLVPFAPGGSSDALARAMSEPLARRLAAPVVVENRPGAGGLLSNEACARAAPDGTTLCLGSSATHSVMPHMMAGRPGADAAGFTPVSRIGEEPNVMLVRQDHPARDMATFRSWMEGAGPVAFGVGGPTSASLLMMRQLAAATGWQLEPVLYRGGTQTPAALLSGDIPVAVGPLSSFVAQLGSGAARPLLILGPSRVPTLPGVPTIGEAVLPGAGVSAYVGVFAPAGLPPPLAARLHGAIADSFAEPALRDRAAAIGVELALLGPADFARWLDATAPRWAELVRAALAAPPPRDGG
jgi:tripartite-type tricarboxylate transporter receptor subunit TctC